MALSRTQAATAAAILLGTLVIGGVDYITGIEIRIFPLYFLSLVGAAWMFGRTGAVVASIFAACAWVMAEYMSGRQYSSAYIWGVNFITQGTAFMVVSLLVAALRGALFRERELSRTDLVTGIANRRALYEVAGIALTLCHRNKRPATLAFIDLDNFKSVNDTFGHDRGDMLLRKVAEVLTSVLRSSDVVARIVLMTCLRRPTL